MLFGGELASPEWVRVGGVFTVLTGVNLIWSAIIIAQAFGRHTSRVERLIMIFVGSGFIWRGLTMISSGLGATGVVWMGGVLAAATGYMLFRVLRDRKKGRL